MKEFLKLNKNKFILAAKVTFIIFFILLSVLYLQTSIDHSSLPSLVFLHLTSTIGVTLFVLGLIFLEGYSYYYYQRRLFSNPSLKSLFYTYKFITIAINENSKWRFTQEAKWGQVDDYIMFVGKNKEKSKCVNVAIAVEYDQTKLNDLNNIFNPMEIKIESGWAWKSLPVTDDIEKEIKNFTELLKSHGIYSAQKP